LKHSLKEPILLKLCLSGIFIFFIFSIVREITLLPIFIEVGLTPFYAEKVSYIIFSVFILIAYKKILIENDVHIKQPLSFSNISVKNIFSAITISFLFVPLAFGFNAIEVLIVAQFSPEAASNLWDFKPQEVVIERNDKLGSSFATFLLFALVHSLVGPLVEEMIYRGPLLSKCKNKYALLGAILITSVLFTIIHSNAQQYLQLFIFSLVVAYLTIKTGRIVYAFILHSGYNLFSWLMEGHNMLLLFTNKPIDALHRITLWKSELSLMLISLILIIYLWRILLRNDPLCQDSCRLK